MAFKIFRLIVVFNFSVVEYHEIILYSRNKENDLEVMRRLRWPIRPRLQEWFFKKNYNYIKACSHSAIGSCI